MVIENMKAYKKQHRLDNPKIYKISRWKNQGLRDDFELVYDRYVNSTNCENCKIKYGKKGDGTGTFKCMDHDHSKLQNNFRNILCSSCNLNLNSSNTSGYPNIVKKKSGWEYKRTIRGNNHTKRFKTYYEVVVYKYLFEYFNVY